MRIIILPALVLLTFWLNWTSERCSDDLAKTPSPLPASSTSRFVALPDITPVLPTGETEFGNLQNLTRGGWRIVSITSDKPCDTDGDGNRTQDIYSEMPICALDDVMMIRENGKVYFKRNDRCTLTEDSVETYDWTLTKSGVFTMASGSVEAEMRLKFVTSQRLGMQIPMESLGEHFVFTVTYEHE